MKDHSKGIIGTLMAVDETTVNVLLEVKTPDGKIVLIPANEDIIRKIDPKTETLEVCLPEGLIDLNDNN